MDAGAERARHLPERDSSVTMLLSNRRAQPACSTSASRSLIVYRSVMLPARTRFWSGLDPSEYRRLGTPVVRGAV